MAVNKEKPKYSSAPPIDFQVDEKEAKRCRKLGHIKEEVTYYDSSGIVWCGRCGQKLGEL